MKIIDACLMDELSAKAKVGGRLRQNLNFHDSYDDPSQRMLIAIEPGSYIRPHRHLEVPKPEAFLVLKGKMAMMTFDDQGNVTKGIILQPGGPNVGADLPPGIWHTLIPLESGTILYETKPGPFVSIPENDMAPWAPAEGDSEVADYIFNLLGRIGI